MHNNTAPAKWLQGLFYIHIASLAVRLLSMLPVADQLFTWLQRILIAGVIFCLFQLSPAGGRYRKAAILQAVYLGGVLVSILLRSTAISLAASICSLLSIYQEYCAHSELIAEKDVALSRKWHSLFTWSIIAGVLVAVGSMIISVITVLAGMETGRIIAVVMVIISLPDLIVSVFYLMYLKYTIRLLPQEESGDLYG